MKKSINLFKILSFLLCMYFSVQAYSQEKVVTGTVTTKNGETLPGVNIIIKGTSQGIITDINGKYSLKITSSDAILQFSSISYVTQEIPVMEKTTIDVIMEEDVTNLDEIVVVGYGTQKKSLVTGSIAKVNGSDMVKESSLKVAQALQGKTAGVFISSNSGQPGETVSVRIRGTGSNKNNEPLYVVDGMPLDGYGIDFLNSSDIESVEVLKDGASAAIYGARAANGVVLITTKQGKKNDKFTVSYDAYYGIQNPWKEMEVLNAKEYMDIMNEASLNSYPTRAVPFTQERRDTIPWNTDWQKEMFYYNAPKVSHVLSFNGGTDKSTYSSSFSYNNQDGIVSKGYSNYERFSYRLNTTREFGILTLGSNINLTKIKSKGIGANDSYDGSALIQALNLPPVVPVKYDNGEWATPEDFGLGLQEISNPIALTSYRNQLTVTKKLVGSVYADFDFEKLHPILKGLHFKSNYSTEYAFVNYRSYTPIYSLDATHFKDVNSVNNSANEYTTWNIDNTLTYIKSLGDHNFTLLYGHTAYKKYHTSIAGEKTGLIFNDFEHAYFDNSPGATGIVSLDGTYDNHTLLSYFGRIDYDYKNKYMLTGILRKDGSSRFGSQNKFGYFPSISLGWVVSKEDFFPKNNIINFMKVRTSWGQNGNEISDDFRYTSIISTNQRYYFGVDQTEYSGMQPAFIPTPSLKWETSDQKNIAFDMGFLKNKITLTVDLYSKTTIDWILKPLSMAMVGNNVAEGNGGKVTNKGIELELGFKSKVSELNIDVKITGGYNKNEVLEIPTTDKALLGSGGGFGQSSITRAEVGEPLGFFWAYKTDGIFQTPEDVTNHVYTDSLGVSHVLQPNAQPGDIRFVDVYNDGTFDDKDRVKVGDPNPDFTGGLNTSLDWKGIDFNMFWYAALGQQNWMALRRYDQRNSNYSKELIDSRWTGEGTSNKYPRVLLNETNSVGGISGNWQTPSDIYIYDASYVRLKNITLGYTLPAKISNFVKISKFRIYISAENLITITKYPGFDPEIGGSIFNNGIDKGVYPQAKTYLAGVNVTF
jgi:TonB-linked SusC/RagA family outer membrane protein